MHAIDYLVKPVRVQRLLSALQKVPRLKPLSDTKLNRLPAAARRFLSVTERSRVVLVPIDEIVYLKAELKYITIRTADRGVSSSRNRSPGWKRNSARASCACTAIAWSRARPYAASSGG